MDKTHFVFLVQGQKKLLKLIKDAIQERRAHPEKLKGDFLDQMLDDMKQHKFITDNTISFLTFGLLLATVESMSSTITVTIKLLIEHPHVVEELMVRICQFSMYFNVTLYWLSTNLTPGYEILTSTCIFSEGT